MSDDLVEVLETTPSSWWTPAADPSVDNVPSQMRTALSRVPVDADAGPEYQMLWVPPGSSHCPLAWNLQAVGL
jgi:hypothetical protein